MVLLFAPLLLSTPRGSWAERRAGSVRQLDLKGNNSGALKDFGPEDLGTLVAVASSSLTELSIGCGPYALYRKRFWESVREPVVPAGRLRSLVVKGVLADVCESEVEPLGQLVGILEELVLSVLNVENPESPGGFESQLPRFPESFCALTELRRLYLVGHSGITAIPAKISSLKKLKDLSLYCSNRCSSLPKELGELSGLTRLNLDGSMNAWNASQDEAFPAGLGEMKSLRVLKLGSCGLRTVLAFLVELESLTKLDLSENDLGNAPQDEAFPAELGKEKSLRDLDLRGCCLRTIPAFVGEMESLETLDISQNDLQIVPAFVSKLESLEKLSLSSNRNLGNAPQDEAFLAELGKVHSLRYLSLAGCSAPSQRLSASSSRSTSSSSPKTTQRPTPRSTS